MTIFEEFFSLTTQECNNILISYFLFTLSSDHLYCSATLTEFEYALINTLYHHLPGFAKKGLLSVLWQSKKFRAKCAGVKS